MGLLVSIGEPLSMLLLQGLAAVVRVKILDFCMIAFFLIYLNKILFIFFSNNTSNVTHELTIKFNRALKASTFYDIKVDINVLKMERMHVR